MDLFSILMHEDRQNTQGWFKFSLFCFRFFLFISFLVIHVYGANCFQCRFSCDTADILSSKHFGVIFHECLGARHIVKLSVKIKWPCSVDLCHKPDKTWRCWYYALPHQSPLLFAWFCFDFSPSPSPPPTPTHKQTHFRIRYALK